MGLMTLMNPLPRKAKGKKRKARKTSTTRKGKVMAKASRKKGKKRRSAAQKAATARMLAARGHKRSKRSKRVHKRRRIITVTSHRSTVQGQPVTARGRIRARKRKIKGYSANPMRSRRRKHSRRSNPISLKSIPQTVKKVAMPVALGVAASIAIDKLMPKVPVPAMLQVAGKENMRTAYLVGVRTLAIVAGMLLARKAVSRETADGAGIAALGVTYTDLARSLMADHLVTTAAVHGYDLMGGYDMSTTKSLAGDASRMGGYDQMGNINSVNSTVN